MSASTITASRRILLAALLASCLTTGVAAQMHHDHAPAAAMPGRPGAGDTPTTKAFKDADTAMMKAMQAPYTGNPDVDFRTHMIPHHQGAVAMAQVALRYAADAETRAMAQKIIDDQEKEIAAMQDWLKRNRK